MRVRSFQAKLLILMIAALILLQAATLVAVHVAGQRTMRKSIAEELRVGGRVLDRILTAHAIVDVAAERGHACLIEEDRFGRRSLRPCRAT